MFSMTKSRCLDEVQTPFSFVAIRHYGEDVKFCRIYYMPYIVFSDAIISTLFLTLTRCHPSQVTVHLRTYLVGFTWIRLGVHIAAC